MASTEAAPMAQRGPSARRASFHRPISRRAIGALSPARAASSGDELASGLRLGHHGHVRARSVSIAELKDNLSAYLRRVRQGEEIIVRDRKVPVAKLVPLPGTDEPSAERAALIADGKLKPGQGGVPASFWKLPAPSVSERRLLAALDAERQG
jgi:prevent-host-death family protein